MRREVDPDEAAEALKRVERRFLAELGAAIESAGGVKREHIERLTELAAEEGLAEFVGFDAKGRKVYRSRL